MADSKISALPSATIPLAGTEVLPIVQSSTTVKVASDDLTVKNIRSNATNGLLQVVGPAASATRIMTVPDANFTAARIDAAQSFTGNQTLSTGNVVMGVAGKGIDFSATPNAAGMTSEVFSDYEEGTWTPTISFQTPGDLSVTYSNQVGSYTKIGNRVALQGFITTSAFTHTTASGYFYISGLPFSGTTTTYHQNFGAINFGGVTKAGYTQFNPSIESGFPNGITIYCCGSGVGSSSVGAGDIPSGGTPNFKFTIVYESA